MHAADTPYADLTPDLVLDALEALGQAVDGRVLQLNSYENRVFQVGLDGGSFVVAGAMSRFWKNTPSRTNSSPPKCPPCHP